MSNVFQIGMRHECQGQCPTLLGGYCEEPPAPTMARMLHRNSISTMLMPPLSSSRRNCKREFDNSIEDRHVAEIFHAYATCHACGKVPMTEM